jgi:hypothetical protein
VKTSDYWRTEPSTNMTARAVGQGELARPRPAEDLPRAYFAKREPCWICSKSLRKLLVGTHRGKYVAALKVIDGFERRVHVACAGSQ